MGISVHAAETETATTPYYTCTAVQPAVVNEMRYISRLPLCNGRNVGSVGHNRLSFDAHLRDDSQCNQLLKLLELFQLASSLRAAPVRLDGGGRVELPAPAREAGALICSKRCGASLAFVSASICFFCGRLSG